jgi:YfiH family protein
MHWTDISGVRLGYFPVLDLITPGLRVYCTTRLGGVSRPPYDSLNLGEGLGDRRANVQENRRILSRTLGLVPERLARAGQVHGTDIAVVARGGIRRGTDGLVTTTRGLALAISTADCYPVIIHSPPERALAALHLGRSGAAGGIIHRAMHLLTGRFELNPATAVAVIGPGICSRCYTVWKRSAARFPAVCVRHSGGRHHLDLRAFCIGELREWGLRPKNIFDAGYCTSCHRDLFFSHRRDGSHTGRHWTVALLEHA